MSKSIQTSDRRNESRVLTSTGKVDAKGRQQGFMIRTFEVTLTEAPEGHLGTYFKLEAGEWFGVRIQATRDDVPFGASQPDKYFKTEAERQTYIAKRTK